MQDNAPGLIAVARPIQGIPPKHCTLTRLLGWRAWRVHIPQRPDPADGAAGDL